MKERPILFNGPMVRALLAGTKTQTRRVVKPEGAHHVFQFRGTTAAAGADEPTGEWGWCGSERVINDHIRCPYGKPGDRLWVREAWARTKLHQAQGLDLIVYREGDNRTDYGGPWKPGIHMFRRDSRILLEVTGVRVERLQDIHPVDALQEGLEQCTDLPYRWDHPVCLQTAVKLYSELWEQINGPGSWDANPWVWVIEFQRIDKPQAAH